MMGSGVERGAHGGSGHAGNRNQGQRVESTGHCLGKCTATESSKNERTNTAQQKESPSAMPRKMEKVRGDDSVSAPPTPLSFAFPKPRLTRAIHEIADSPRRFRCRARCSNFYQIGALPDCTALFSRSHRELFNTPLTVSELTPTSVPLTTITKQQQSGWTKTRHQLQKFSTV